MRLADPKKGLWKTSNGQPMLIWWTLLKALGRERKEIEEIRIRSRHNFPLLSFPFIQLCRVDSPFSFLFSSGCSISYHSVVISWPVNHMLVPEVNDRNVEPCMVLDWWWHAMERTVTDEQTGASMKEKKRKPAPVHCSSEGNCQDLGRQFFSFMRPLLELVFESRGVFF